MVNHIIAGVDGSAPSLAAARYALALAEQTRAKLTLVFVLEMPQVIPVGALSGYVTTGPTRSEDDVKKAEAIVEAVALERPSVKATTRVELGEPSEVLVDLAKSTGADLLVVGARGLNAAQRFLVGSVSDRIVHHAHCPVLVVRH